MTTHNNYQGATQHLSPREQRCLEALKEHPKGIKSYDLRALTQCSYVPDVIRRLIARGYQITCTMKPDGISADGQKQSIGWYCLIGFVQEVNIGKI